MTGYVEQMKALDEEYQRRSGITDRRRYKIFYSHIHMFPLMVLGYNPGGHPDDDKHLDASKGYYEKWEHDMVAFRTNEDYRSALQVFGVIAACLGSADLSAVSRVPYTNVIFRRSKGQDHLKELLKAEGKSEADAVQESAAVLTPLLKIIAPRFMVIFKGAFAAAERQHFRDVQVLDGPEVFVKDKRRNSTVNLIGYRKATLAATGDAVQIALIAHPSHSGGSERRDDWADVCRYCAGFFNEHGLAKAVAGWRPPSAS